MNYLCNRCKYAVEHNEEEYSRNPDGRVGDAFFIHYLYIDE